MNGQKFFELFIVVTCLIVPNVVYADNTSDGRQLFNQRIEKIQNQTGHLCSYIQTASLVATKDFIRLMQDAHSKCPNLQSAEVSLANIGMQGDTYHTYVTKQSSDCKELLHMLTKSLNNGGLVDFYLKEGNYSLVTSIIDKWHETFLSFKSQFHLEDIPLNIILTNKRTFFHDSWFAGMFGFAATLIGLLVSSLVLLKFLTEVGLVVWIVDLFVPPITSSRQERATTRDNPLETGAPQTNFDNTNLVRRNQHVSPPKVNGNSLVPNDSNLHQINVANSPGPLALNTIVMIIRTVVWLLIFGGLILITLSYSPTSLSLSQSARLNWYPEATTAIEKMRVDRDEIQSITARQILSIEELQGYVNMYDDQTIQENTAVLISNLGTGIQRASKEVAELYIASEKLPSVFRHSYTSIEAKAKSAGRLAEAKNLLEALKESGEKYELLQRSIQALMVNQEELLPLLKQQTQAMHVLVQQGYVLDLNRIAKEHIKTTMVIDDYTYKVDIAVKDLIEIVDNDSGDGMKNAIKELQGQTALDQYKSMLIGAVGGAGGLSGSALVGTIAMKSGFAIVSVTVTAVAAPVAAAAGAVGLLGLGGYAALKGFGGYNDAARYKTDLDIVEAHRGNLHTAMKSLEKALDEQQTASKATQIALDNIVTHSASFSSLAGFVLPTPKRTALSNELLHIIQQYNTMSSIFNSFKPHMANKDRKRLAA